MLFSADNVVLQVPFTIKSICATSKAVLFWSGKQAAVYRLIRDGAGPLQLAGDFKCESVAVALLGDETVFTAHDDSIVGYVVQFVLSDGHQHLTSILS